jgi:hypothetical protein
MLNLGPGIIRIYMSKAALCRRLWCYGVFTAFMVKILFFQNLVVVQDVQKFSDFFKKIRKIAPVLTKTLNSSLS